MHGIDKALRDIRPSLRIVAPMTYYIAWGFALFNVVVSAPLYRINEDVFGILGAISLKVWAIIFMLNGLILAYTLLVNKWKSTRGLMLVGVCINSAWLMELIARTTNGKSFILVAIWGLIVYLQAVTYLYFTPQEPKSE